jgi:peptidoglycan-N-acetylglucosamine deacetylase
MVPRRRISRPLLALVLSVLTVGIIPPAQAGGAPVVRSGPHARPWIALTFDDGWGTANCRRVVAILKATHTPATFLPTALHVQWAPGFWRSVARAGFPIGNHTVHHRVLDGVPAWRQDREIAGARTIIERITGMTMAPVLRPPTGAFDETTRRVALRDGFVKILLWDTTFADTSRRHGGGWWPDAAYYRDATSGGAGSVILGHCGADPTVRILPRVIAYYRARGLRFVTVNKLFGLPDPVSLEPSPTPTPTPTPTPAPSPAPSPSIPAPSAPA